MHAVKKTSAMKLVVKIYNCCCDLDGYCDLDSRSLELETVCMRSELANVLEDYASYGKLHVDELLAKCGNGPAALPAAPYEDSWHEVEITPHQ